ncbi:MAG: hypothetical protein IJW21_01545 [Clostridia bacterium]|nr:hypothetical protein [Clostridia bacterium]
MNGKQKIKCPRCGSGNALRMDGNGVVSKYGNNVMVDIAPEMWLCGDCRSSFEPDDIDTYKRRDENEA